MLEVSQWEKALDEWLEPFLAALGHKARCRWAPVYLRGLFGRTERKSVQPMAAEVTPDDYDQLHNFVASPAWDTAPLDGTRPRWKRSWRPRPTPWSVATMPS